MNDIVTLIIGIILLVVSMYKKGVNHGRRNPYLKED